MRQDGWIRTLVMVAAMVILAGAWVERAEAWWDGKWQLRKKITFDTTEKGANVSENMTEVPILVRLHAGNFSFDSAKEDGSDIRFVSSDDKTPLKYHLEKFDAKQGIALFWVKAPQIAGASAQDHVWLYYGNSGVQAGEDSGGTYDTPQAAVFHFNEGDGVPKDATAYQNHGADFTAKLVTPAIIGNGVTFAGGSEHLTVKRSPSLNPAKGFSFSVWIKPSAVTGNMRLFSWDDGKQAIVLGLDQGGAYGRVGTVVTGKSQPLAAGAWHHVALSAEPGKNVMVYVDGRSAATAPLGGIPSPGAEIGIGGALDGSAGFAGDMDEARVAAIARPAGWFALEMAGQGEGGKLVAVSEEEAGGSHENLTVHLMRVIARSVTLDGWLVIGLCSLMLMFASFVFINKAMRLKKIKNGNREFLDSFNDSNDPLALGEDEQTDYGESTLHRIYLAGYNQIQAWTEKHSNGNGSVLTPSAINIFRAALERASSDESRRLSAWMMVLTLSISAGPFLGLLGTVWGVMNTFAGLAEAGEANLSAIAPGVASALACTLFGLVLAIPCLFAYSFLVAHIKHLNTDTRHFIEEYTLRVEGLYGEDA